MRRTPAKPRGFTAAESAIQDLDPTLTPHFDEIEKVKFDPPALTDMPSNPRARKDIVANILKSSFINYR